MIAVAIMLFTFITSGNAATLERTKNGFRIIREEPESAEPQRLNSPPAVTSPTRVLPPPVIAPPPIVSQPPVVSQPPITSPQKTAPPMAKVVTPPRVTDTHRDTARQKNVEEQLVQYDPTVPKHKKWLVGGDFGYWYISQGYNTDVGTNRSQNRVNGYIPAYTLFVGYDNVNLQLSYRYGQFSANNTLPGYSHSYNKSIKETELELAARYIFYKSRWLNPYAILGYNYLERNIATNLNSDTLAWSASGNQSLKTNSTHNSLLTGIGTIIPFNEHVGLRIDYRLLLDYFQGDKDNASEKREAIGLPMRGTVAGYWNIYRGLNLQLGSRYDYFPAIVNFGASREKIDAFSSVGYSHKF